MTDYTASRISKLSKEKKKKNREWHSEGACGKYAILGLIMSVTDYMMTGRNKVYCCFTADKKLKKIHVCSAVYRSM